MSSSKKVWRLIPLHNSKTASLKLNKTYNTSKLSLLTIKKMMNQTDVCKFCHSNGEAEAQYKSHQLKNSSGLVTCPVLRSFVCTICKATGDFAHTQRYCPRNKNGQYNTGASLSELKRRKNAAGNFPSKKIGCPNPSYPMGSGYAKNTMPKSSPPFSNACGDAPFSQKFKTMPRTMPYPMTETLPYPVTETMPMTMPYPVTETMPRTMPYPVTDPLPSYLHPVSPPTILASQPPCTQLTMYRHQEYIKYYHEQQLRHEMELQKMMKAFRRGENRLSPPTSAPCYARSFPAPKAVSPPRKFLFPEVKNSVCSTQHALYEEHIKVEDEVDRLGYMLAELRQGTLEVGV